MFDLKRFIAECETAVRENDSHVAVKEVVARAVAEPAAVLAGAGRTQRAAASRRSTTRRRSRC